MITIVKGRIRTMSGQVHLLRLTPSERNNQQRPEMLKRLGSQNEGITVQPGMTICPGLVE